MEQTLHALGEILLKAVPTFVLVLLLYGYLSRMFFSPLEKVLKKRYDATEGARKLAEESQAKATAKTEEYEAAIRTARVEVYQELGEWRRQLQGERAEAIAQARKQAEAQISQATAQLNQEVAQLKQGLAGESDALATEITNSILRRRVA
jgi:F0F1-type ATP synthase membrane subunit b/b'